MTQPAKTTKDGENQREENKNQKATTTITQEQ